ncbi:LysE family translocator [Citrobacter sp. VF227]
MTYHTLLTFSLITLTQTLSIGPAVSLLLTNYFNAGFKKTLPISFAFRGGESVSLLIAFLITTILHFSAVLFIVLKITGGLYLVFLGAKGFFTYSTQKNSIFKTQYDKTIGLFPAFLVPIINPKALIYFSSFIPSFIDTNTGVIYGVQFLILSCAFLLVSLFSDMCFLGIAASAKKLIGDRFITVMSLTSSIFLLITGMVFIGKEII